MLRRNEDFRAASELRSRAQILFVDKDLEQREEAGGFLITRRSKCGRVRNHACTVFYTQKAITGCLAKLLKPFL